MKLVLKGFFSIMFLLSAGALIADNDCNTRDCGNVCERRLQNDCGENECPDCDGPVFGKTFFSYRPQDSNTARRMVGVIDKTHRYGSEEMYTVASVAVQGQRTTRRNDRNNNVSGAAGLARFLSFNNDTVMTYGPTCGAFDIFSLNFGTTATAGIANATAGVAPAANALNGGLCFTPRISNVIVDFDFYTAWDEFVCGMWTRLGIPVVWTRWELNPHEFGVQRAPACCFPTNAVTVGVDTGTQIPFPTLLDAWDNLGAFGDAPAAKCGRLCGDRTRHGVAGLHLEVGYDFWRGDRGFLGVGAHVVAPTGTRPTGELFFTPVIGSNHSWQLGGTVQAGYRLWENCDGNHALSVYFDSIITHLFGGKQSRLFGLKIAGQTSPGSSFLLLKKFDAAGDVVGLERAQNLLCCETKIKADVMADLSLLLQYDKCNWSAGIGYNFWIRTKEKLDENSDCFCNPFGDTTFRYAIKGATLASDNNSSSTATISGAAPGTNTCAPFEATPVFLTNADVDPCVALNGRAFSNKVFGFVGYNWKDCEWAPFALIEGGFEFGHENRAADQWEVMLKGGISF